MEDEKLGVMEKGIFALMGPVYGLLPPRWQEGMMDYEGACIASTSSRICNAVLSLATLASIGAITAFGVNIDSTQGMIATDIGLLIGADTIIREGFYGAKHYLEGGRHFTYREPWGEPITSIVESALYQKGTSVVNEMGFK